MKNRNKIGILSDILTAIKEDETPTTDNVSNQIELKQSITERYFELMNNWGYLTLYDGYSENDAKYSVTIKGEKLLALLKKESSWY